MKTRTGTGRNGPAFSRTGHAGVQGASLEIRTLEGVVRVPHRYTHCDKLSRDRGIPHMIRQTARIVT